MPHTELHETARALVAEGKGILAADESDGTIKKRFDTIGVESTEESRRGYRNLLFTTPGAEEYISGVILFDETIRQTLGRRDAVPGAARLEGRHPGDQGRQGREAARARRGRDGDRGARRPAPAARGVPRARSALREVARDLLDHRHACRASTASGRTRTPSPVTPRSARRPGSSRSSSPRCCRTGRTRSSAAASSPPACSHAVYTELFDQRVDVEGTLLKPNMVLSGYDGVRPRRRRGGRRGDAARADEARAGGGARHRLPLRRPVGRGRDRAPQRDERARAAPVAAVLLLRPRAAGAGAEGVGRQGGEHRGRPARVLPPREDERGRAHGHVRARDGARGRRRVDETDRCGPGDGPRLRRGPRAPTVRGVPPRRQRRGSRCARALLQAVPRARARPQRPARPLGAHVARQCRLGTPARLRGRRPRGGQRPRRCVRRSRARRRARTWASAAASSSKASIGPRGDAYSPTLLDGRRRSRAVPRRAAPDSSPTPGASGDGSHR